MICPTSMNVSSSISLSSIGISSRKGHAVEPLLHGARIAARTLERLHDRAVVRAVLDQDTPPPLSEPADAPNWPLSRQFPRPAAPTSQNARVRIRAAALRGRQPQAVRRCSRERVGG